MSWGGGLFLVVLFVAVVLPLLPEPKRRPKRFSDAETDR